MQKVKNGRWTVEYLLQVMLSAEGKRDVFTLNLYRDSRQAPAVEEARRAGLVEPSGYEGSYRRVYVLTDEGRRVARERQIALSNAGDQSRNQRRARDCAPNVER